MPFYALVDPATGESLEVVTDFDGPIPDGLVLVELPAPRERVSQAPPGVRDRGGGADTHEAQTGRETDPNAAKPLSQQSRDFTAGE